MATYTTINKIDELIKTEQAKYYLEHKMKISQNDVFEKISKHCGVSTDYVSQIKRGLYQPTLPIAILIADFFGKPVEDVFTVKETSEIVAKGAKVCTVDDCNVKHYAKGLCRFHYQKEQAEQKKKIYVGKEVCNVEGCGNKIKSKGLCFKHYKELTKPVKCNVDGCEGGIQARGLCPMHYQQQYRKAMQKIKKGKGISDT